MKLFIGLDVSLAKTAVDPPPLKWSSVNVRKRRTTDVKQAREARRDRLEVTAG